MTIAKQAGHPDPPHSSCHHEVEFFLGDNDLFETVAQYALEGMEAQEAVVLFTCEEHWQGVLRYLSAQGVCVDDAVACNQLVFIDSDHALEAMVVDDRLSAESFEKVLSPQLESVLSSWSTTRLYGDAVGRLVQRDQYLAMQDLEECWNDFLAGRGCPLLCGYQLSAFDGQRGIESLVTACQLHNQIRTHRDVDHSELSEQHQNALAVTEQIAARKHTERKLAEAVSRERLLNRRKDEFLAMLAHELRNPLAPIVSAVEVMKLRGDQTSVREREIIERQVGHIKRLVGDLLDVSEVMFGHIVLNTRPIDLCEPVAQAVETVRGQIEAKHHDLHIDVTQSGLVVEADPDRIAQAVGNILANAAKYTPEGGNIWLRVAREGGSVVVSVRDDGAGISAALLEDIFTLFSRGEHSRGSSEGGLGLGLALVHQIAEMHDGEVQARSEGLGRGSEFSLRLPLTSLSCPKPRLVQPTEQSAAGRRILIVDDNVDFALTLSELLEMLGNDVCVAHDGQAALEVVEEFWPEVALLDIGLPGMNGVELGRRLKQLSTRQSKETYLISVSGYGDESRRFQEQGNCFDAGLIKPVGVEQLREALENAPTVDTDDTN